MSIGNDLGLEPVVWISIAGFILAVLSYVHERANRVSAARTALYLAQLETISALSSIIGRLMFLSTLELEESSTVTEKRRRLRGYLLEVVDLDIRYRMILPEKLSRTLDDFFFAWWDIYEVLGSDTDKSESGRSIPELVNVAFDAHDEIVRFGRAVLGVPGLVKSTVGLFGLPQEVSWSEQDYDELIRDRRRRVSAQLADVSPEAKDDGDVEEVSDGTIEGSN